MIDMGRTYRRITSDRIRKWMKIVGVTSGASILFIFAYLATLGDINIVGHSGDMVCAGTPEEPCYAYINFTMNKDYIYLYPNESWYFNVDSSKHLDIELQVRDLRYKSGWRTIDLTQPSPYCQRTGCKYAYRFYKTKGLWQIRFKAVGKDINETLKWSFGNIDPLWKGYKTDNFFTKLISNKANLGSGEAEFILNNPTTFKIPADTFNIDLKNYFGSDVHKIEYYILRNYTINVTDYNYTIINKTCFDNTTNSTYDCSYINKKVVGYHDEYRMRYDKWNPKGYLLYPGKHQIKIKAYWNITLGKQSKEWIPQIDVYNVRFKQFKWAWWNSSWTYKKPINVSVSSGSTVSNYQVLMNVTYDSDMNADFSDLRFVNGSENTELSYWISSKVNSSYANVWVKVDQPITTNNYTIYMYYGNAGASTTSNISATFIFGDDFEDGDDAGWSTTPGVSTNCDYNVQSFDGSYIYNITVTTEPNIDECAKDEDGDSIPTDREYVIEFDFYDDYGSTGVGYPVRMGNYELDSPCRWLITAWSPDTGNTADIEGGACSGGSWDGWNLIVAASNPDITEDNWYHTKMVRTMAGTNTSVWLSSGKQNYNMNYQGFMYDTDHDVNGSLMARCVGGVCYYDNIFIREYHKPEPVYFFGSEQATTVAYNKIVLNSPIDSSVNTSLTIKFAYTPTFYYGEIQNCSLWNTETSWSNKQGNTTEVINNSVNYISYTFSSEGTYTWNVQCYNETDSVWGTNRTLTIDTSPPQLWITEPLNITYNKTNLDADYGNLYFPLYISTSSDTSSKWYSLNNGNNITITSNTSINGTEGLNSLYVYANDSAGNINETIIYFTINTSVYTVSETEYATGYHTKTGGSVGDGNNDGLNEIIFGDARGSPAGDPELYVAHWNGTDFNFTIAKSDVAQDSTSWVENIRFGDADNDGIIDILFDTGDASGDSSYLLSHIANLTSGYIVDGYNTLNWRNYYTTAQENYHHGTAFGNITGDGYNNIGVIFCGGGDFDIYNISYTSSSRTHLFDYPVTGSDAIEADLNNDGRLEVITIVDVWSSTQQIISHLIGLDYQIESKTWIYNESSEGTENLHACDLDGDGTDELVAVFSWDQSQSNQYIAAFKWNGSEYTRYFIDDRNHEVNGSITGNYTDYHNSACFDFDNDGKDELITLGQNWSLSADQNNANETWVYMYKFDENMIAYRSILARATGNGRITQSANLQPFGDADNDGDNEFVFFRTYGHSDGNINDGTNYMVVMNLNISEISDTTPPEVTITSPQNTTYNTQDIWINATTNEAANMCRYNVYLSDAGPGAWHDMNSESDTSWYANTNLGNDGLWVVNVTCNDTAGNYNTSVPLRYFTVRVFPEVNFISPTATNGTESYGQNYITWNISVSQNAALARIQINGTNQTMTCYNASSNTYCIYNETGLTTNQTRCAIGWVSDSDGDWNKTDNSICRTIQTSATDTCTAPASGVWNIDCSDNCVWNTNQTIPDNISITGSGTLSLYSYFIFNGINQYITISPGCQFDIYPGGGFE